MTEKTSEKTGELNLSKGIKNDKNHLININDLQELDRRVLEDGKDLYFIDAVFLAFPDAKRGQIFGITACGEKLLVRRFNNKTSR